MTELFSFSSADEACSKMDSLGGYVNPEKVAPLKGAAAHEVAVGPVHAGVIEPGHFRFMCRGEKIDHLEIQLGYQHRGIENLMCQGKITSKRVDDLGFYLGKRPVKLSTKWRGKL